MAAEQRSEIWKWECDAHGIGTGGFGSEHGARGGASLHVLNATGPCTIRTEEIPLPETQTVTESIAADRPPHSGCRCQNCFERLRAERDEWRDDAKNLSEAYLRLRRILGAMNYRGGSPEPNALWSYVESVARLAVADSRELHALWNAVRHASADVGKALLDNVDARPESYDLLRRVFGTRVPPLGNPTREEAIAALKKIADRIERYHEGGRFDIIADLIRQIIDAVLPNFVWREVVALRPEATESTELLRRITARAQSIIDIAKKGLP